MRLFWLASFVGSLVALVAPRAVSVAQAQPRGCDPTSPMTSLVPPPDGERIKCGDNVRGRYTICTETTSGGGCGTPVQSSRVCRRAMEVCDGRDLGGSSCTKQGFAGGTLACGGGCESFDISSCDACFARSGVSCGVLPDVNVATDTIERIALSDRAALVVTAQHRGSTHGLHIALVGTKGVVAAVQPLVSWTDKAAATLLDVAPMGTDWVVWYVANGRTWEQRYNAAGVAAGPARDVGEESKVVFAGQTTNGAWRVVIMGIAPARMFEFGAQGLGKEVPLSTETRLQRGDDLVFIVPIPDAKPGDSDLAVFATLRGSSGLWLWSKGRSFGGGLGQQATMDLGINPGHYTVAQVKDDVVTTWTPVRGKPWTVKRSSVAPVTPKGVFAKHASVSELKVVRSAKVGLSLARFPTRDGTGRVLTALTTTR